MPSIYPVMALAILFLIGPQLAARGDDSDSSGGSLAVSTCSLFQDLADDGIRVDGEAKLDALLESTTAVDEDHLDHSPLKFTGTTSGYMSVKFVGSAAAVIPTGTTFMAHVHAANCKSGTLPGGDHYKQNASVSTAVASNELWFSLTVGADGRATASVQRSWFADYDKTMSVVIHDSANVTGSSLDGRNFLRGGHDRVACCDLVPPLPALPTSWTVSIEANILAQRYTVERDEIFDSEKNLLVIQDTTHKQSSIDYIDFKSLKRRTVYGSNHTCVSRDVDKRTLSLFAQNATHGSFRMISTAEYLRFATQNATYVPGRFEVRGVPCEKWMMANVTDKNATMLYTAAYYFTEDSWNEPVFSYHRSLRRVTVDGLFLKGPRTGSEFHNVYEFTDFRPFVMDEDDTTNVCHAYGGRTRGCGCPLSKAGEGVEDKSGELAAIIIFLCVITATVLVVLYLKKKPPAVMKKYMNETFNRGDNNSSNPSL